MRSYRSKNPSLSLFFSLIPLSREDARVEGIMSEAENEKKDGEEGEKRGGLSQ